MIQTVETVIDNAGRVRLLGEVHGSGVRRALQAQRYARRRLEGLVKWNFPLKGIDRGDWITWAFRNVQKYFQKV